MQETRGGQGQGYVLIGLFSVFLVITGFSIAQTSITPAEKLLIYDLNIFSLVYYVPLTFWVGLLGILFLFLYVFIANHRIVSSKFTDIFLFVLMITILLVVFGLPYIVEPNPRFVDSWVHGGTAKNIIETGRLNPQEFPYQNYPLSFVLLSMLSIVSGLELTVVLRFLPSILIFLFFTSLTVFFNKIVKNSRLAMVSVLVFALSTFYLPFHFSPEAFGWIFFFLLFALLVKDVAERKSQKSVSKSDTVVLMLLIVAIAITHPVTQFMTVLIMLTLAIAGAWIWKVKFVTKNIVFYALMVFSAWAIFFGYQYFEVIIKSFEIAILNNLGDFSSSILLRNLQESSPLEVANLLLFRRALYLLVPITAIYGVFHFFRKNKAILVFFVTWLSVAFISLPLTVFGLMPLERPIKIAFIPLALFSACLVVQKKKLGSLLLIFLLVTIPINFASFYWNEASTMTHNWELASAEFIGGNFNGTILGEFKETSIMRFYGNYSKVFNDYSAYGIRPDIFNMTFIRDMRIELVYITQLTIFRASLIGINVDAAEFINDTGFNCIYSNGYSSAFLR